jgi:hypothetical protein
MVAAGYDIPDPKPRKQAPLTHILWTNSHLGTNHRTNQKMSELRASWHADHDWLNSGGESPARYASMASMRSKNSSGGNSLLSVAPASIT